MGLKVPPKEKFTSTDDVVDFLKIKMCIQIKGKFEITPFVENLALIYFNETLTDKVNNKVTFDPHVMSTDLNFTMMTRVNVTEAIAFTVKNRNIN